VGFFYWRYKERIDSNYGIDFDMTMSRHWVRNKETDALERNSSSHGIPSKYDKMTPEVSF
jgi:hypothetical protein